MRPERFQQFAIDALAKAPDIQAVEPWRNDATPRGLHVTFTTGAQLWISMTSALAPGEKHEGDEIPVHAGAPTEVAYPELYKDGTVTPDRAKHYLAAALTNSGCDEIERAYAYADTSTQPGFGVIFHSGARAFCLFAHTARPGQSQGGRKYELQGAF